MGHSSQDTLTSWGEYTVSLLTIEKSLCIHQNILGASEEKAEPVSAASSVELNTNNQCCGENTEDDTHESVDLEDQDEIHMGDGDDDDQHEVEPQPREEASANVGVEDIGGLEGDGDLYNNSNSLFMHDRDNTAPATTSTMHDVPIPATISTVMHDVPIPATTGTSTLHISHRQ
jgi:hypothetical protein